MAADYSIWVLCYARTKVSGDFMGGSPIASNSGTFEIPMLYTLVVSAPDTKDRRVIAIDTGFGESGFASAEDKLSGMFTEIEWPGVVLGKIGFRPEQVDTVILTHMHADHAGNVVAFPKAKVYVQREEYEGWTRLRRGELIKTAGVGSWAVSSINWENFDRFDEAIAAGRVTLLEGDREVAPGITCRLASQSHTFGSQWVEIQTSSGPHIVAGDCVYWYANLEKMWPPGYIQGNPWNVMQVFEKMNAIIGDKLPRVVPGHDMEVFKRNANWTVGPNPVAELHLAPGEKSRRPD
ncbi:MAG TPA: N-acyl homoserine lactonase family protein [Candidatus Binataceae bacterium]|nr:N-acyl homoserine lactonase family protein [Candidatus Binataceae bacterium]